MTSFKLRWKGRVSGPFTIDAIREMLADGRIGLMYQIELHSGKWIFLKDFPLDNPAVPNLNPLESREPEMQDIDDCALSQELQTDGKKESKSEDRSDSDAMTYLLYALCGASFLSPFICAASLALAGAFYSQGRRSTAFGTAALSLVMGVSGWLFFKFLYPIISASILPKIEKDCHFFEGVLLSGKCQKR